MPSVAVHTAVAPLPPGTALAIGAFDGLHLGHQALVEQARRKGTAAGLLTFDPHPAEILAPERAPPRLATAGQRIRLLERFGVAHLVLLPFDRTLAALTPEAFVERVLLDGLRPRAVIVGASFRFGRGRSGGPKDLSRLCARGDVEVVVVDEVPPPPECGGGFLSSTEIRRRLAAGDVAGAACLLGRPHAVEGVVERGAGRGRALGVPTANVGSIENVLPAPGIYAGALAVLAPERVGPMPAAISLGRNPTFTDPGAPLVLEVHVLDRDLDLYGARVEVSFVERLRDELAFDDVAALLRRIEDDVARTRRIVTPSVLANVLAP
ncbi:MAG: bifunctional riboflavin kinase/FAD synthetase [Deltaproteobacteria bacterium]|nr:MAG: bifunctional riboflavin kinase/FAD synthetase [Deltaproteobacteria bacterium]